VDSLIYPNSVNTAPLATIEDWYKDGSKVPTPIMSENDCNRYFETLKLKNICMETKIKELESKFFNILNENKDNQNSIIDNTQIGNYTANIVFQRNLEKNIYEAIGFVTVQKYDTLGKIGLIATHPDFQGKGFGKKLLKAAQNYYLLLEFHKFIMEMKPLDH
jgi:hypothetical protein